MDRNEKNAMEAAFARWLRRARDLIEGDVSLAHAAWVSAWAECRREMERLGGPG